MADQHAGRLPWPSASATGVGSMPGSDPAEALRVVLGELPGLPHLPELPARGPGADLTGRAAALLIDLPVETTPAGWRFAAREGRDLRRARGYLSRDLDTLEEVAARYQGPFKIQVCGPWTLAATIELGAGRAAALADPGALRDLAGSLAEGVAAHVADVAKRLPGAHLLLQLDEPALPAVLAGAVPTASGLHRLAAVDPPAAQEAIRAVLGGAPEAFGVVHCCAPSVPLRLLGGTGARAVSLDLALLARDGEEAVAELAEAGLGLLAGVVPALPPRAGEPGRPRRGGALPREDSGPAQTAAAVARVTDLWRRLGLPAQWCAERVVLTPSCGLAGAPPRYARAALARCREAARAMRDELEG